MTSTCLFLNGQEEKFRGTQDMNTHLLSANLDFDSRLQHVSCCVLDECLDSENHALIMFFSVLVGTSFSRLVWVRRTFQVVGSFHENTSFSCHRNYSPGSYGNSRVFGIFDVLINRVGILNGPEHLCNFVSFFSLRVSVSVWNETENISMSLRRC